MPGRPASGVRSETWRSGTNTALATMSRLPVAAMPSTCQVSRTSTASGRTRNMRGGPSGSVAMRPESSTQSACTMPVPKRQCPLSSKPSPFGTALPSFGLTLPGARTKGWLAKISSCRSGANIPSSQLCSM